MITREIEGLFVHESPARGPALFFLHANSHDGRSFACQLAGSLAQRFHVVTVDLPGHGRSARAAHPQRTYSIPGYIDAVQRVVNALSLGPTVFVGHSLGGHILIQAAEGLQEMVGLAVFGTPPMPDLAHVESAFLPHPCISSLFKEQLTSEDLALRARAQLADQDGDKIRLLKSMISEADPRARSCLGASLEYERWGNEPKIIESMNKPFYLLHGSADPLINPDYLNRLDPAHLWGGRIHHIEDTGHCPHMEQPVLFDKLIADFAQACLELKEL